MLAIVNAVIRETLYKSKLGDNLGYALSSIIAVVYTLAVICLFVNHVKADVTTFVSPLFLGIFSETRLIL